MILVDTNVLVALVDDADALHARAKQSLRRLGKGALAVTAPVLAEALYLLPRGHERQRLAALLHELRIAHAALDPPWWAAVFAWMETYAEHEPDLADAELVLLCAGNKKARVWTYDREFRHVWRLPNGKPVPTV